MLDRRCCISQPAWVGTGSKDRAPSYGCCPPTAGPIGALKHMGGQCKIVRTRAHSHGKSNGARALLLTHLESLPLRTSAFKVPLLPPDDPPIYCTSHPDHQNDNITHRAPGRQRAEQCVEQPQRLDIETPDCRAA